MCSKVIPTLLCVCLAGALSLGACSKDKGAGGRKAPTSGVVGKVVKLKGEVTWSLGRAPKRTPLQVGDPMTDPEVIERTVRAASTLVVDRSRIRIVINPDDMEAVKGLLPEFAVTTRGAKVEIAEDSTIERGGCILETGFGRINATIESQRATLQKELEAEFHAHLDRSHAVVA